jgi:O-antigen/teichoic acid export membrane protein
MCAQILPWIYGQAFTGAVRPTWLLLGGLLGDGVAGLITAYLYGVRRPGLNSLAVGVGVIVTVVGDVLLIPPFGVMGAALASALAYLTTSGTLLVCFYRVAGRVND